MVVTGSSPLGVRRTAVIRNANGATSSASRLPIAPNPAMTIESPFSSAERAKRQRIPSPGRLILHRVRKLASQGEHHRKHVLRTARRRRWSCW